MTNPHDAARSFATDFGKTEYALKRRGYFREGRDVAEPARSRALGVKFFSHVNEQKIATIDRQLSLSFSLSIAVRIYPRSSRRGSTVVNIARLSNCLLRLARPTPGSSGEEASGLGRRELAKREEFRGKCCGDDAVGLDAVEGTHCHPAGLDRGDERRGGQSGE